ARKEQPKVNKALAERLRKQEERDEAMEKRKKEKRAMAKAKARSEGREVEESSSESEGDSDDERVDLEGNEGKTKGGVLADPRFKDL
nr:hypothetical protein [Tanacetum cinerariifolium]